MHEHHTTASVQRYLVALSGDESPDPIVRALIARAANRLHGLCAHMLRSQYPRLRRAPVHVQDEELLSLLVERLLKAMRQVKPSTVREFFALANRHLRWELNEFARQLARRPPVAPLPDDVPADPPSRASTEAANLSQILAAIDRLPDELREIFSLVHVQSLTHFETAEVLGVSTKTVQRRLRLSETTLASELSGVVARGVEPGAAGEPPVSGHSAGS